MNKTREKNLYTAISVRFRPDDAKNLASVFGYMLGHETVSYEEIPLPEEAKQETLLICYDERALLPCNIGRGAGWQARPIACAPGETYFMPRIARRLLSDAAETSRLDSLGSLNRLWKDCFPGEEESATMLFSALIGHAKQTLVEAGLIAAVARSIPFPVHLHDLIDNAGILGVISPHPRGSTITGLSWYQINPVLFWERGRA